jgi:hypothetical protein
MTRRFTVLALSAIVAFGFFNNALHAVRTARRSGYIVASS